MFVQPNDVPAVSGPAQTTSNTDGLAFTNSVQSFPGGVCTAHSRVGCDHTWTCPTCGEGQTTIPDPCGTGDAAAMMFIPAATPFIVTCTCLCHRPEWPMPSLCPP